MLVFLYMHAVCVSVCVCVLAIRKFQFPLLMARYMPRYAIASSKMNCIQNFHVLSLFARVVRESLKSSNWQTVLAFKFVSALLRSCEKLLLLRICDIDSEIRYLRSSSVEEFAFRCSKYLAIMTQYRASHTSTIKQ